MAKRGRGKAQGGGSGARASRVRLLWLAGLSVAGLVLALWLTWIHLSLIVDPATRSACNFGGTLNCDAVNTSRYATVLGIPIAWLGASFYLLLLILAVRELRGVASRARALAYARWFGLVSVLYSIYLALVSTFAIRAVCVFCVGLHLVNLGVFLAGWRGFGSRWQDFRPLRDLDTLIRRGPSWSKIALVAWLAAGIGLVVAEQRSAGLELPAVTVGAAGTIGAIPGQTAGAADAKLTVALFSDFECPYCRNAAESLDRVMESHGDRVRFVYKHFPLDPACNRGTPRGGHRRACDAAAAAVCAAEQGKFWEYHTEVFRRGAEETQLRDAAKAVGLDMREFSQCRASERTAAAVRADVEDGLRMNVQSTPTFLIGDQLVPGALTPEQLADRIDRSPGVSRQ